jgi:hypothetical protein
MRAIYLKSFRAGLFIFCVISLVGPYAHASTRNNWEDIILSPNPQMDLKQVIQVALPDMESQVQKAFNDNIDKIKQIAKKIKDQTGISAGMAYEVTLIDVEGNKVAIECDMLDLAGWDQKSKIPFKFKIEKKDVGTIEVSYDPKAPIGIKEIKLEKKMPGGVVSQYGSIAVEGTWEKPEIKINYGQKVATPGDTPIKLEAEQSIGLDLSRSADDLYDKEWNPRSESAIVRGIENIIAMTNWGVKASVKYEKDIAPGEKITTGLDLTINTDRVRSAWTDWLFSDMNEAYDNLHSQLDHQAQWRRDKIEAEAIRLGIKPGDKNKQQLNKDKQASWNANPGQQRPIFRNPGPKPADSQTGTGVRAGNTDTNQPGVTLNQPSATTTGQKDSTNWTDPNKGWTDPNKGWTDPNEGWTDPNKGWTDPNEGWTDPNEGWTE